MTTTPADQPSSKIIALEVKTLKGDKVLLEGMNTATETVQQLYDRVAKFESSNKWKLALVIPGRGLVTVKYHPTDSASITLDSFRGLNNGETYRVEVILDMGACHGECRR